MAAECVLAGEGHVNEGWMFVPGVLRHHCTDVYDTLDISLFRNDHVSKPKVLGKETLVDGGSAGSACTKINR